jgi:hypothetical protein
MSEEQIKPKRKWYKNWVNWINIVVLLLFIAFICVIIFLPPEYQHERPTYNTPREQIQNAVVDYQANHNGSLPTLSGTYTNANCSNCGVINISALLATNGGYLRTAPDCLNLSTNGNDNCGGNASLGCKKGSHYIWIVDSNGSVYSTCVGKDCTSNSSGYQGVWP